MKCRHCGVEILPSDKSYKQDGIEWIHLRTNEDEYQVACDPMEYYGNVDKIAEPGESYVISQILTRYDKM